VDSWRKIAITLIDRGELSATTEALQKRASGRLLSNCRQTGTYPFGRANVLTISLARSFQSLHEKSRNQNYSILGNVLIVAWINPHVLSGLHPDKSQRAHVVFNFFLRTFFSRGSYGLLPGAWGWPTFFCASSRTM
jgi:hypothetical protein